MLVQRFWRWPSIRQPGWFSGYRQPPTQTHWRPQAAWSHDRPIMSSPWIWKGVYATLQSGRYTLSYIQGDDVLVHAAFSLYFSKDPATPDICIISWHSSREAQATNLAVHGVNFVCILMIFKVYITISTGLNSLFAFFESYVHFFSLGYPSYHFKCVSSYCIKLTISAW